MIPRLETWYVPGWKLRQLLADMLCASCCNNTENSQKFQANKSTHLEIKTKESRLSQGLFCRGLLSLGAMVPLLTSIMTVQRRPGAMARDRDLPANFIRPQKHSFAMPGKATRPTINMKAIHWSLQVTHDYSLNRNGAILIHPAQARRMVQEDLPF